MINVLHLRDTDRICGPGKTIIETACAVDSAEFSLTVGLFLLNREKHNAYYDACVRRGVDIVPIRSSHQLDPRVLSAIARIVRERRIDIIHSHEYKSDILTYLLSRVVRIPIMTTVHGWIANHTKAQAYIGLGKTVLRRFNRVIAVSGETRQAILRCGVADNRVVVIHNAIVTDDYDPAKQFRGAFRQRLGLPADALLIGYVGRLSAEKGQRDFLIAAAEISGAYPSARFAFVGDGPDKEHLEQLAAELGIRDRVVFAGHLTDVRPAYRDFDLFALTSHTEGFPNVVLEALCMDTPVLATDVGGTREVVHDGETGILIPSKQPAAIAHGLRRLIDAPNRARDLARAGKQLVFDQFSFTARVRKEEALYRELVPQ
jgi:glycosyltransferase involved in cell wall biosynthesis